MNSQPATVAITVVVSQAPKRVLGHEHPYPSMLDKDACVLGRCHNINMGTSTIPWIYSPIHTIVDVDLTRGKADLELAFV